MSQTIRISMELATELVAVLRETALPEILGTRRATRMLAAAQALIWAAEDQAPPPLPPEPEEPIRWDDDLCDYVDAQDRPVHMPLGGLTWKFGSALTEGKDS